MSILDFLTKLDSGTERAYRNLARVWIDSLQHNVKRDCSTYPSETANFSAFISILERAIANHINNQTPTENIKPSTNSPPQEIQPRSVDASPIFYISTDQMTAYLCILPPLNDGAALDKQTLEEKMTSANITWGIDQDLISRIIASQNYLHIYPIARGALPQDGTDGSVTELLERKVKWSFQPASTEGPDFSQKCLALPIHKGDIICRIQLPTNAQDGHQVTGQTLPGRNGTAATIPAGNNTVLSDDKQLLLAAVDGLIFWDKDHFTVYPQNVVTGDIDQSTKKLNYKGDLFISGSVKDGVKIEASGNIVIQGKVTSGTIIAGDSIRVQQGVKGEAETALKAAYQIQCAFIENASAEAVENIYTESITNSNVTSSNGSIYVTTGRGQILAGNILARHSVFAKKIGSQSGPPSTITAGYYPGFNDRFEKAKAALDATHATLSKIQKNISYMRMAGDTLSREKRVILSQLLEQRALYEEQIQTQKQTLRELENTYQTICKGKVRCDELYPGTKICIGTQSAIIQHEERSCNIHLYAGKITVK